MPATMRPTLLDRPLPPGNTATLERRHAALAAFEAAGWPTPQRERWRYTNLSSLASADLDPAPRAPGEADIRAAANLLDSLSGIPADRRLVLLDGYLIPSLGALTVPGVAVDGPAEPGPVISAADHPLAALNTAFGPGAARLRVARGASIEEPLHVVLLSSSRVAIASQPHVVIEAAAGASVTVVQHVLALPGATGWLNAVTVVRQGAGAHVELYRLQYGDHELAHTSLLSAELAADAELRVGYFDLGGRLVRNDIDVKLLERGARSELFGLLLVPPAQHIDDHVTVDHASADTRSEQAFRALVGSRGRAVFNGKVIVRPNAQRIDARQSSDNLLLGELAEIDAKPELEIYADDVKCSHGTTVGELDTEQLFYLQARGIGEAEARQLLTRAFAEAIVERIGLAAVRGPVAEAVGAALTALTEHS